MLDFVQPFKGAGERVQPVAVDGRDMTLATIICTEPHCEDVWGFRFLSYESHAALLRGDQPSDPSPMTYLLGEPGGCEILPEEEVSRRWGVESTQFRAASTSSHRLAVCGSHFEGVDPASKTVVRGADLPDRWYRAMCYPASEEFELHTGFSIYTLDDDYIRWANKMPQEVVAFRLMPNETYDCLTNEKRQLFFIDAQILRLADVETELGADSPDARIIREHNTLIAVRCRDGRVHRHEMNAQNVR